MSNLEKHAKLEFKAAGWLDDDGNYIDEMQEAVCRHVLALLDVFSAEGHSGSSAPYTVDLFRKLAMFEPVVPLTGYTNIFMNGANYDINSSTGVVTAYSSIQC